MSQSDREFSDALIKKVNPLSVMQQDEETVTNVTRSPVGIFILFAAGAGFLVVVALIALLGIPSLFSNDTASRQMAIGATIFVIAAVLVTLFLFLANKIYWDNYWVVTDDSITQVTRTSLFDRQASQLSLANLEDVTAEQHGILAELFNYGILNAETAAASEKFILSFVPHPDTYARQILAAHEDFLHRGKSKEPDGDEGTAALDSYEVPTGD